MVISQAHNLQQGQVSELPRFGLRVSLSAEDPFQTLLGTGWNRTHWFETPQARDAALLDMSRQHEYSRAGDKPTLIFTPLTLKTYGITPPQNVRPKNK